MDILKKHGFSATNSIYIPGNVYSSKNHKRILIRRVGKSKWSFNGSPVIPFIGDTEAVMNYKKNIFPIYLHNAKNFQRMIKDKDHPIRVTFFFIRENLKPWDFNNMSQLICDMMVKAGWLKEDNSNVLLVFPPLSKPYYTVDKPNSGVIITVL